MAVTEQTSPAQGGLAYDLVERAFLLVLSLSAIARMWPLFGRDPHVPLLLISEGLAVAFILLRRRTAVCDQSPYATGVAFIGTAAPLLVIATERPLLPAAAGFGLMIAGLLLNISAKIALNRSFGLAAANRGVKRAGPYRLLRHPMYAGYALTQATFLLLNPCLWNLSVYLLSWTVQVLRIRAEERLLLQDPAYRAYADTVRYRIIPGLY